MGKTLTLTAKDGHTLAAYRASPTGAARGGIVVLQEIFGVNSHIRSLADAFAGDGYVALAPALFDRAKRGVEIGYTADDIAHGLELRKQISNEQALADTQAAIDALAAEGLKVAVVGYCWGGSLAWTAATRLNGVAAAVSYYGSAVADMAGEQPNCPVMLHFGESDHSIPLEKVEIVRASHPDLPLFVYPAGHGFSCDARAAFHPESARLARERSLAFLKEHVG